MSHFLYFGQVQSTVLSKQTPEMNRKLSECFGNKIGITNNLSNRAKRLSRGTIVPGEIIFTKAWEFDSRDELEHAEKWLHRYLPKLHDVERLDGEWFSNISPEMIDPIVTLLDGHPVDIHTVDYPETSTLEEDSESTELTLEWIDEQKAELQRILPDNGKRTWNGFQKQRMYRRIDDSLLWRVTRNNTNSVGIYLKHPEKHPRKQASLVSPSLELKLSQAFPGCAIQKKENASSVWLYVQIDGSSEPLSRDLADRMELFMNVVKANVTFDIPN